MKNIALEIRARARERGSQTAHSHKIAGSWQETTYFELEEAVARIARALVGLGVDEGDKVAIFAPNSPDWIHADLGIQSLRAVSVPIFATSTVEQARYIVEDAGIRIAFAGAGTEMKTLSAVREQCGLPEVLIAVDGESDALGDRDLTMGVLMERGRETEHEAECVRRAALAAESDLATIIYTSGTTGEPKGVMLTHANFQNQFDTLERRYDVTPEDRSLCFLPLSHVYERAWSFYIFLTGAQSAFVPDPRRLAKYLVETQPTVMASAPRLYEKIYSTLYDKLEKAPAYRRQLFHWAVRTGGRYQRQIRNGGAWAPLRIRHAIADRLVLSKIRAVMGGPKKFLASGGAALAREIEELFFAAGILICQGYGLTETAPMLTSNCPDDFRFGTVGKVVEDVELRIADSGEIMARGPNVMSGYFNKPEETAAVFTDGWFHTGDVGHFDSDGYLVITDRIKDLIVTAGGKNVAPQLIEMMVGKDPFIEQLAVLGDRRKYISALIVPAFDTLAAWARKQKLHFESHEELIHMPEVMRHMTERIKRQSQGLAPFEKIKRFKLLAREFTIHAGEITPTLKVKRRVIIDKYRELIESMYP